jgi:hypothetical protein
MVWRWGEFATKSRELQLEGLGLLKHLPRQIFIIILFLVLHHYHTDCADQQ